MSSISPLTDGMRQGMQQIAQVREGASMKEFGSLRGIGEHLLYLFTFGLVDKGRERIEKLEKFIPLMANMTSLGSRGDGLECQFRDPYNVDQLICIKVRETEIYAEVVNEDTNERKGWENLSAVISASYADMTSLLLKLCIAGKKNDASKGCWESRARVNLANIDLREAILEWADLTDADLTKAKLMDADLTNADLTKVILIKATMDRAKLGGGNPDGC